MDLDQDQDKEGGKGSHEAGDPPEDSGTTKLVQPGR